MPLLQAVNLHKSYNLISVLKGVNLTIEAHEVVSIMGASGAGKSTLLHLLGTLDKPDKGHIYLNNLDLNTIRGKKLADFRNHAIGFIFQFHNLLSEFTVLENVCLPAWIRSGKSKMIESKALTLLERLGIADKKKYLPSQLSGGEQQRSAVARALINDPQIILADEPSGNLDSYNALQLHKLFLQLRETLHQTFVIVTHNRELANFSDKILTIKDGLIE